MTIGLESPDMSFIRRIVYETAHGYAVGLPQMFKDAERADFLAFIGRKRDAVAQEEKRARWGQRGTSMLRLGECGRRSLAGNGL